MAVDKIILHKIDEVNIHVESDMSIAYEISDFFSFKAPNFWFHPLFKNKIWDGTIHLFSSYRKKLYIGLIPYLEKFAKSRNYIIEYDPALSNNSPSLSPREVKDFVTNLDIHVKDKSTNEYEPIKARDYQLWSMWWSIKNNRVIIISPTASGKSFIIYALVRYYQKLMNKKIIIIVPTIGLVTQMYNDFDEYSYKDDKWFAEENVHMITGGVKKLTHKPIIISTWQSIYKQKEKYFQQFGTILGDECHLFQAKSLTSIMKKLKECPYRIGFTGTLNSNTIHNLVLEGLFGKSKKVISTKELMDRKEVAQLMINCLVLEYSKDEREYMYKCSYQEELAFIIKNKKRNNFITNLAVSRNKNTLILITRIKHGEKIFKLISKKVAKGRNVYLVNGNTHKEDRERIRIIVETEKDAIIIASYGVFSMGISIKNLHYLIFGSPYKSEYKILQSIGRGLRVSKEKTHIVLYDIVDNLIWKNRGKPKANYFIKHFKIRMKMYIKEKFDYKMFNIKI